QQQSLGMGGFEGTPSQYNPLDEPSPLGLRLRKSPSLLELIQMKLSQSSVPKVGSPSNGKKESSKAGGTSGDKLKASNFPGSVLRIGTWEYKSRYEGDLVAKCYFAKHKLVWEVLDGGLKNKIEIQWSDIMALKATYSDDHPGTLDVVLARQPLFFRETNPQPRKHTLWQATSDFTGGQASIHRQHYLECPQGLLGKHFEKLVQCDPRLHFLSQQGEITTLDSPYFEPRIPVFDDQSENNNEFDLNTEGSPSFFSLQDTASPSGPQSSSSKNDIDVLGRHSESYPRETPSPSSAMGTLTVEDIKNSKIDQLKELSNWDQIKAPGLHSSMSMSDLVSHLEHRISEQGTSNNPTLSSDEWQSLQILDDIKRCLFSDNQNLPDSDEKSLMSRVDSLCCLLQKDAPAGSNAQLKRDNSLDLSLVRKEDDDSDSDGALTTEKKAGDNLNDEHEDVSGMNQASSMSRKDSVGDLLLNLPRIASLPQFLFNISEDYENQAR
ncbi:ATP-dependent DNA helicase, partial [Perilla frutescens var. hirtella]